MFRFLIRCVQVSMVTVAGICVAGCFVLSRPFIRGRRKPVNSLFHNGKRFENISGSERTLWSFFKWFFVRDAKPWPKSVEQPPQAKPVERAPAEELKVTFVNHSTVLIQWEGYNIITDPVWAERASPFSFAGPKRVVQPGIRLEDLPPLDLILLSHNHYDHMDTETLRHLSSNHGCPVVTGLGNGKILEKEGISNIVELDWWKNYFFKSQFEVVYVPAEHFSSRGLFDKNEALWGGFMLRAPSGNLFFAGDTGYGEHFKEIKRRLGAPKLALLPIGAYKPEWFMKMAHNSPIDSVQAHIDLEADKSLAVHWDTFHLGEESYDDPPKVLRSEMIRRNLPPQDFFTMRPGEEKTL